MNTSTRRRALAGRRGDVWKTVSGVGLGLVALAFLAMSGWVATQGPIWIEHGHRLFALADAGELFGLGTGIVVFLVLFVFVRGWRRVIIFGAAVVALLAFAWPALAPGSSTAVGVAGRAGPDRSSRLLWVGIDGLTWQRALPLIHSGRLPNFERLYRRGSGSV